MNNQLVENTTTVTVPRLLEIVGTSTRARWQALGQTDSKIHWAYGAEAEALISEGFPAMVVYKAIAVEAGKSSQTIRKAYYTFVSFTPAQREKYNLAPYSVFQHARTQADPEQVLKYYVDNRASVDELEQVFPEAGDDEFEKYFSNLGYPRIYYGIMREAWGLPPASIARLAGLLDEVTEIINEAYK